MIQKVRIIADHREERSGVVEELRLVEHVEVEVRALRVGDYGLPQGVVVERKSLLDLAGSLKDGRLFSQAARLAGGEDRAAIILEGQGRDLLGCEMRREALLGAIVSLSLIYGLAVLRSADAAETARVLVYAARQLECQEKDVALRHGKRPKGKRRVQLRLLQGLPGVGPGKAVALLDRFGSVAAVVNATREELGALDGFGPKGVDAIRRALD